RDAAVVDDLALPLGADVIERLVNAYAAPFLEGVALGRVVADADDQLVVAVAVQVGTPDTVAPAELFVDHVPVPHLLGRVLGLGVDNDLVAVPWLDGGDVLLAVLQLALLDLAGAAIALRVGLVALADVFAQALVAVARQQVDALVAGDQHVLALALGPRDR